MEKDDIIAIAKKTAWNDLGTNKEPIRAVLVENTWYVEFEREGTAILEIPGPLVRIDDITGVLEYRGRKYGGLV